jgi:hypothetical protein
MQRSALTVVLFTAVASSAGGAGPLDLATLDVCARVPGEEGINPSPTALRNGSYPSPLGSLVFSNAGAGRG